MYLCEHTYVWEAHRVRGVSTYEYLTCLLTLAVHTRTWSATTWLQHRRRSTNDGGTERFVWRWSFRNGIVIYPYSTLHGKPSADADNFIVQRTIQRSFSFLVFYLFSLPLFHKLSLLLFRFVLIFICTCVYMHVSNLNLLLLFREEQL